MDIIAQLTAFATKLEDQGLMSLASDVDGATSMFVKVAKELGPQGYAVQNGRCWAGCYRSKRASKPKTSAQEIWFECHEEYEKALAGNSDSWNKYAGSDAVVKVAETKKFANTVRSLTADGEDIGTAVFNTLSRDAFNSQSMAINAAETLINVSEKLELHDLALSTQAAELSSKMVKEAWGFGGVSNMVAPITNKMRGLGPNSKKVNLTNISTLLNQLNTTLQGFVKQKQAFESAVKSSPGIPPQLQQTLFKGLRPLSQKSITEMMGAVQKYTGIRPPQSAKDVKNQGNSEAADRLHQMVSGTPGPGDNNGDGINDKSQDKNQNGKLDPNEVEPTDPSANGSNVDKNKNGVPDENEGVLPLKAEDPAESHDEGQFSKDISSLPDEHWTTLMQQAAQFLGQGEAIATGRQAARRLFSLIKTANAAVFAPPARRNRPAAAPGAAAPAATVAPTAAPAPIAAAPVEQKKTRKQLRQEADAILNAAPADPADERASDDFSIDELLRQHPDVTEPQTSTAPAAAPAAPAEPDRSAPKPEPTPVVPTTDPKLPTPPAPATAPAAPVAPAAPPATPAASTAPAAPAAMPGVTAKPPRAPKPKPAPAAAPAPTGPITKQDFSTRFQALTPEAKQFVMKSLVPMVQKIKQQTAQDTQHSMMGDTMASAKKRLFKLA